MKTIEDRTMLERETRAFTVADLEVRSGDDTSITFDGIASRVDTPYAVSDIFGEYTETIARGAFKKTLQEKADVRLLVNHEGVPLARTKSNTLTLTAAPHLRGVAELDPANPDVQRIQSAMNRGDLDQMSIGFRVHRQEWNEDYTERNIREIELFDVSIVTFPASPTTSASLRSIDELLAAFPVDGEYDPDELRRAIVALEALLPAPVIDLSTIIERDFADRDRLARIALEARMVAA